MSKKYIILAALTLLALVSCKPKEAGNRKASRADDVQPVILEELSLRPIDEYIMVSGKVEGIVNISMSSETSGRILELNKKLGDRIEKGERLGRVDNDVFKIRVQQSEAALQSAQSAFENARQNASFAEESYRRKLISELEYNSILSALKGAQAGLDGAKANLESARTAYNNTYLVAPEAGNISNLFVSLGQVINPNQAVAQITDASTLILKTGVGETQIAKLKKGQLVEISYPGMSKSLMAVVRGFGISPLPGSATYPIEIELKNKDNLMPGMVVSARILSNRLENKLFTTITNISREFDRSYVFIMGEDNTVTKREVQLGQVIGENVMILSGVVSGDRIVISGTENLEDGMKVQIRQ